MDSQKNMSISRDKTRGSEQISWRPLVLAEQSFASGSEIPSPNSSHRQVSAAVVCNLSLKALEACRLCILHVSESEPSIVTMLPCLCNSVTLRPCAVIMTRLGKSGSSLPWIIDCAGNHCPLAGRHRHSAKYPGRNLGINNNARRQ